MGQYTAQTMLKKRKLTDWCINNGIFISPFATW